MTSAASGGERGAGRRGCKRRHVRVRGSGMHGAASGRRAWEARADSVTGATKWQSREGGRVSPPPGAPGSCHSPGGGRATGRGHAPPRGRLERMAPGGRAGTALAARWTGCPVDWPAATGLAIAAAAMPKRKKQDQPPPLPQQQQHLALSERDEPGDEEDERPMGQPSVNYSPEGRRGEKNYDGPTVKDHPAFWALPPWLTGSLVIPSQLSTGVLQDQGDG